MTENSARPPLADEKEDLQAYFRSQMPVSKDWVYLDHASVAPLPRPAADAIRRWVDQGESGGNVAWPEWNRGVQAVRDLSADLLGAKTNEIALVPNTTTGLNLVAQGFPWKHGDNVVTAANEFPSNLYPWEALKARGVELRLIQPGPFGEFGPDQIRPLLDKRTRLVSISWVGYATGFRCDLSAISQLVHEQGAYLCVDAIQGLGAFPIHVHAMGIDFLAADGHKWILGPEGAGIFFLNESLLELLEPLGLGWGSSETPYAFQPGPWKMKVSAARYEGGSLNMAGFLALAESLKLLQLLKPDWIAAQIREITDYACEKLAAIGASIRAVRSDRHYSGIVPFQLEQTPPEQIKARAKANGVILSCRAGFVRISPHAYNNPGEIDRLLAALPDTDGRI